MMYQLNTILILLNILNMKLKLLTLFTICMCFGLQAQHIYVKPLGTGDGSSWANATSLGSALASSLSSGDKIHIAAGTYRPSVTITNGDTAVGADNDLTFEIKQNVELIGGYSQNPTTGEAPNPSVNETILSGLLENDSQVNHVIAVTAPKIDGESVKLYGLTIKEGHASDESGAGTSGELIINDLFYPRNYGAGIIAAGSRLEIDECIISNNTAVAHGVAMLIHQEAEIVVNNSKIIDNGDVAVSSNGVGMWLRNSTGTFNNCTVAGNETSGVGSGVYIYTTAKLNMNNCTIANNIAGARGGAIYARGTSDAVLINCTISGNSATNYGGGIHTYGSSVIDVISSTITNNNAPNGGGVHNTDSNGCSINLYNSIVSGNFNGDGMTSLEIGGTITTISSIVGEEVFDASGTITSGTFDASTMLDELSDNGGDTATCKLLLEDNNPAIDSGMTVAELQTLGATYSPVLSNDLLAKDQLANDRVSNNMGALDYSATLTIEGNYSVNHFELYPNPATQGYVVIRNSSNETIAVSLYDVIGNLVLRENKLADNVLDISRVSSGMYLMQISQGKSVETKKLIVK